MDKFRANQPCAACQGKRLKPEALAVKVEAHDITDIARLSIADARDWFAGLGNRLTGQDSEIATRILKEINERLGFLVNVGLGYLSMARNSGTLSGGESQRIRLASQIGSGLTGVLYVLDEPSIGLHQRDNDRLLRHFYDCATLAIRYWSLNMMRKLSGLPIMLLIWVPGLVFMAVR